jgi:hypothetical protein
MIIKPVYYIVAGQPRWDQICGWDCWMPGWDIMEPCKESRLNIGLVSVDNMLWNVGLIVQIDVGPIAFLNANTCVFHYIYYIFALPLYFPLSWNLCMPTLLFWISRAHRHSECVSSDSLTLVVNWCRIKIVNSQFMIIKPVYYIVAGQPHWYQICGWDCWMPGWDSMESCEESRYLSISLGLSVSLHLFLLSSDLSLYFICLSICAFWLCCFRFPWLTCILNVITCVFHHIYYKSPTLSL